jgi:two-component system, NarL family, nitrate/nitrite response regulator NarL
MGSPERQVACSALASVSVLIVSEVRFLRECLAEILARHSEIEVCGQSASLPDALASAQALHPAIVLLDVAFPGSFGTVAKFHSVVPQTSVVALAIAETEENVLAWATAGVAGYVPNSASVDELVSLLGQISRGEQSCPSRITGCLLRRIAVGGRRAKADSLSASLTRRESQILQLIGHGLSNKAIARSLQISLGTTKSHVHNVLGKLNLHGRAEAIVYCAARNAE